MKKIMTVMCFTFFIAVQGFGQSDAILVKMENLPAREISRLVKSDIDIFKLDDKNNVFAYVTVEDYKRLIRSGYQVEQLVDAAKNYADSLWMATKFSSNPMGQYHTYEELTNELQSFAQRYPDICLLQSIGKSDLKRDLWFMKISDNVAVEEIEPEFKYISSIHGNEPLGMELCLYFIQHLLQHYGQDSRITRLVNETEIWIMPLMNPDGYIARQRWNNNGIDLNRNFPDRIDDPNNSIVGRQPETQAVMNFCFDRSFVLSANFHTGALVVNYPYDSNSNGYSVYTTCPDDDLFVTLAKTYSVHNFPMWNSWSFENGITNGADWYVIYGGMQDWNYVWQGCNEVTIELSDVMWPEESQLATYWEDNRESMLSYIEAIHQGVRGVITDSLTGQPLAATIRVLDIDHDVYTDPDLGDYYRLLLPGQYSLVYEAEGYGSKREDSVVVMESSPTQVDVQLLPVTARCISGTVVEGVTNSPAEAEIEFYKDQLFSTETDENGVFQIVLPEGHYDVKITADEFMSILDCLDVFTDQTLHYELIPAAYSFQTNFDEEDGVLSKSDTLWQWGKPVFGPAHAYSGENVWGTNLKGEYPNLVDARLLSPEITLPEVDRIELSFRHWMDAEVDTAIPGIAFDGGILEVSTAGSEDWVQVFPNFGISYSVPEYVDSGPFAAGTLIFSGNHDWQQVDFDLSAFKGQLVQLRFHFGSDNDNNEPLAGWYIDDMAIKYPESPSEVTLGASQSQPGFSLGHNFPNPFNNSTRLNYAVAHRSFIRISVYNTRGRHIKTLVNQQHKPGAYVVQWDGTDARGRTLGSGVFFIKIVSNSSFMTRKILLLK